MNKYSVSYRNIPDNVDIAAIIPSQTQGEALRRFMARLKEHGVIVNLHTGRINIKPFKFGN